MSDKKAKKLQKVYNIVNKDWLEMKAGKRSKKGGAPSEKAMKLIEIIYNAMQHGKTNGWAAYSVKVRYNYGVSCSQSSIQQIAAAFNELGGVKVVKFKPVDNDKADNIEFNNTMRRLFAC
jgi:hypothetical protein|tara:strand:+ start:33 stop:392 length:360 start_codon:yes stop_codon:yes gene_type:complete